MSVPRASIIMTTASCGGSSGRMKPAARSWRRFARAGWLPACRSGRTSAPPARAALLETWLLLVTGCVARWLSEGLLLQWACDMSRIVWGHAQHRPVSSAQGQGGLPVTCIRLGCGSAMHLAGREVLHTG